MPLAPYSEAYWFPNETFAANVQYHVFPRFSNVHAQLFQDQAGTIPLLNPGFTDANGVISFFVENGDYWLRIGDETFYVIVDLDPNLTHVWPSTFRWEQAAPAMVWVIQHGLNSFPNVSVLDANEDELFGEVNYVDDDSLTITFGAPTTGVAFLRR